MLQHSCDIDHYSLKRQEFYVTRYLLNRNKSMQLFQSIYAMIDKCNFTMSFHIKYANMQKQLLLGYAMSYRCKTSTQNKSISYYSVILLPTGVKLYHVIAYLKVGNNTQENIWPSLILLKLQHTKSRQLLLGYFTTYMYETSPRDSLLKSS